jgi:hypothetical protein
MAVSMMVYTDITKEDDSVLCIRGEDVDARMGTGHFFNSWTTVTYGIYYGTKDLSLLFRIVVCEMISKNLNKNHIPNPNGLDPEEAMAQVMDWIESVESDSEYSNFDFKTNRIYSKFIDLVVQMTGDEYEWYAGCFVAMMMGIVAPPSEPDPPSPTPQPTPQEAYLAEAERAIEDSRELSVIPTVVVKG